MFVHLSDFTPLDAHEHTGLPALCEEVHLGLSTFPRHIPGRYLFDHQGWGLFERVCESPSYYLARAELQIVYRYAEEIARLIGPCSELIELGAGSVRLVRRLFEALDQPLRYVPIDASSLHLHACSACLQDEYPDIQIAPWVTDYAHLNQIPLPHPGAASRFGFINSVGFASLSAKQAKHVLGVMAQQLQGGGMLVGIDLVRQADVLLKAHNDLNGLMASFNLNALQRCNRELSGNFVLSNFRHHAQYYERHHRLQLQLVSLKEQYVTLQGRNYAFSKGEPITTLQTYQFSVQDLHELGHSVGYTPGPVWYARDQSAALCWLQAPSHQALH